MAGSDGPATVKVARLDKASSRGGTPGARRWLGMSAVVAVVFGAPAAFAGTCQRDIEVLRAQATFRTRLARGEPVRRDAELKVTVRSTATTAISAIDLAVFLGARLQEVDEATLSSLPREPPLRLPSGGLAVRVTVETSLPPGATRDVEFSAASLPLDGDVFGVTARVIRCQRLIPVGSATVALPPRPDPWVVWLYGAGLALAVISGLLIVSRLRH